MEERFGYQKLGKGPLVTGLMIGLYVSSCMYMCVCIRMSERMCMYERFKASNWKDIGLFIFPQLIMRA